MNCTGIVILLFAAGLVLAFSAPVSAGGGCNGNLPSSTLSSSISSTQNSWSQYQAALGTGGSTLSAKMVKTEFKQVKERVTQKTRYKSIR